MSDGKNYVKRLMRIRCSCGSIDNYLNIAIDHGVVLGEDQQPLMNENDHIANENVTHFGKCKSNHNPERAFRKGLVGYILGGPLLGGVVADVLENAGIMSFDCIPNLPNPWEEGNKKHIVEGAAALTMESTLTCKYGGTIELVPLSEYPQPEEGDSLKQPKEDIVAEDTAKVIEAAMDKIASTGPDGGNKVQKAQKALVAATALPAVAAQHVCSDREGYFSTNEEMTWAKAFECSPAQRGENYEHNSAQTFDGTYLDEKDMIINQYDMDNFHINNFTVARSGCGAIAVYNVLKLLNGEEAPTFQDIIYGMEPYGILNNTFGLMPSGVSNYLMEQEFNVEYVISDIGRAAQDADAAILLYVTQSYAHYVAFQSNQDGMFTFFNEVSHANDVRSFEEMEDSLKAKGTFAKVGIIISQEKE